VPVEPRSVEERVGAEPDREARGDESGEDPDALASPTRSGVATVPAMDPGSGEHGDGVPPERVEGVDLLGHLHGPELGGDSGPPPAR